MSKKWKRRRWWLIVDGDGELLEGAGAGLQRDARAHAENLFNCDWGYLVRRRGFRDTKVMICMAPPNPDHPHG